MNDFYNIVFFLEEVQYAGNNLGFFGNCVIHTFWNDVVPEFNESFLIKLPGEVHTYDSVNSVDVNENRIDHIL